MSKSLYYKGEFYKKITNEEANSISSHKGIQIGFKGELLKKSQIEIFSDKKENVNEIENEKSTEELKSIIGNFEEEYNKNAIGEEVVHNEILGYVKQGTIDHALKFGAIIKNNNIYYIKLPEYYNYQKKYNAMRELISRRDYAQNKNLDAIAETKDKLFNC